MPHDAFYEDLLRPLLFRLEPEDAHNLVHKLLRMFGGVIGTLPYKYEGTDLQTNIAGRKVTNPVGLAAGFDKNADLVDILVNLGFGFAEVGSVTARATAGNPRPRLFRLPEDQALINRLGLNGEGADVVSQHLARTRFSLPVAVNIAKTHDPSIAGAAAVADILYTFNRIKNLDLLYVAINASCPNTREGCMKEKDDLAGVFAAVQAANEKKLPVFVKVSPDSGDELLDIISELAKRENLAGYICGNTTVSRDGLNTSKARLDDIGAGGLSGPPLTTRALDVCKKLAGRKSKAQQIIAVGGIRSGEDAYNFIRAGACAVELYTGLIYRGPSVVRLICTELSQLLKRDGTTLEQAIGADLK